ncbi:IS110 family transposase, partial [Rhizobium leguminosarum]|nr:IS110 family transposase [Rhizobium leguminosarum]
GGRRQIRPALFIAALAACRGDNPLAAAYKALLKAAKPKRVALTAIMRKIITIANARVRDAVRHQNEIMQINA